MTEEELSHISKTNVSKPKKPQYFIKVITQGYKARAIKTWGQSPDYPVPFYMRLLSYDDEKRLTTVQDGRETTIIYH